VPTADLCGLSPFLQPALGQRPYRDVVQGGHHQVGSGSGQHLAIAEAGHANRGHPARLGRLDPAGGVLDHEAGIRRQVQFLGGGEKDHRVGLAAREVTAGDVGVEQLLQRHPLADELVVEALLGGEGVQADPFQEQPGVLRRGRGRDRYPGVLDGEDEPQGVGEGPEPALLDERDDMLLLGRRVLLDPALLVGHPEVAESRPGPGHPRLARHDLLVYRRGEPLGGPAGTVLDVTPFALHQILEGLAPGQFVRRVDQHPVHVEDRASVCHQPLRSSRS
jgi:hypothetical protein